MAKQRSAVAAYLVYLIVRVVVAVLQSLSLRAACRFSELLAWLAYHVNRRHRRVADDNLRHAYPDLSTGDRDRTIRAVYRHFCLMMVEILFMPRKVHITNYKDYLRLRLDPHLVRTLLGGRPILLITGHLGNWEVSSYALGLLGYPLHAIARPLDNPYIDRYLRGFRERTGQKMLAKKGDFDQMEQVLASGGVLGTLADQDAGQRGVFVDFFGRPASTHKAVALLALEHDVVMGVGAAARVGGPLNYEFLPDDLIDPREYRHHPDAVRAITQRFTAAIERLTRRFPEQYFWLHRRWKHQPQPKKRKPAAA